MRSIPFVLGSALAASAAWAEPSPYAGEQDRAIKALSDAEVADLEAGRGMGLAMAAELNGFPGPMHALELAGELGLTSEQRAAIEASRSRMTAAARQLGAEIVSEERALDGAFATATITPEDLAARTGRLGSLQARLRAVHLLAHIETRAVLNDEQVARYDHLRGYDAGTGAAGHRGRHGHTPPADPAG